MYGDESGWLWQDLVKVKRTDQPVSGPRALPPVPDTGWLMPEGELGFPDLKCQGMLAIDVETHDPNLKTKGPGVRRDGYIAGVSVGSEAGFRQYYPVAHANGPNLPKHVVYNWLSDQLKRHDQPKVGANLLYDLDYLTAADVKVQGPFYDVQIAEPLLDENKRSFSLETLAQDHLGEGKVEDIMSDWLERAFGKHNIKGNIWRAPAQIVGPYAEGDVDLPLRIFAKQKPLLIEQGLWDLFANVETPLIPFLLGMRQRGVRVDMDKTEKLVKDMHQGQEEVIREIKRKTGIAPDIWSADSLVKVFNAIGVEFPRTAKGAPSFTKPWLEKVQHPVAQHIVRARKLHKYCGTFLEGYILDGAIDGRIHASFNQLRSDDGGAVSGRFSSSNPNLQNIPIRDKEYGQYVRSLFIPEEGCRWGKLDWSQIEYRLIAHYAALKDYRGAAEVVRRYLEDRTTDYHQAVADMTGLSRGDAKNLNFGLAYGQGIDLLCYNLGVSREEGIAIIEMYHEKAPFIRPLSNKTKSTAANRGYIRTLLGRRRRFDTWEYRGKLLQEYKPGARRAHTHKALNALIQGSAADIMKKAMVEASDCLDVIGWPHLIVHDEFDMSVPFGERGDKAFEAVRHVMENCVKLRVPLLADGGLGPNWGEVTE